MIDTETKSQTTFFLRISMWRNEIVANLSIV